MGEQAEAQRTSCAAQRDFKDRNTKKVCVSCACPKDTPEKCTLYRYKPKCCEDGKDAHHVIAVRSFLPPNERRLKEGKRYEGCEDYDPDAAPCICLSPAQHRKVHRTYDPAEAKSKNKKWKYKKARTVGIDSAAKATGCDKDCLKAQLDAYHKEAGITENTDLRASKYGAAPMNVVPASSTATGFVV